MERVEKICASRIYALMLREKDLPEASYRELAGQIKPICEKYGVRLILHGHYETAKRMGHPYLHLPLPALQELPEKKRRRFWMLGASCHNIEEVLWARKLGCTYVTLSPVFPTSCKPEAEPLGLSVLQEVARTVDIPVLALGGVTTENASEVIEHGADGVCIRSGFMTAQDVEAYVDVLRENTSKRLKEGRSL